ncbi:hypothetical protein [Deinococcus actinosclerus]|uniref:Uncharacterized protein n=1 Tax=Deinococcus actinosclerus TaxID=1768108 RepID=A0ABM5X1I5_9DEIO|nr:hypothetical protein [Deinococcus actinosclerus]ALW87537.1 hypothetical protein AUC44_00345 [Deinococcus actinosclerus]
MTLTSVHPLLNPALPTHRQLPGDVFIWTGAHVWQDRGEICTPTAHVRAEREVRQARLSGAQSELDRLTR